MLKLCLFQDIVCLLEEQLRPLIQAEESVLVDILYRPELMFPPNSSGRMKSQKGGFITRFVSYTSCFYTLYENLLQWTSRDLYGGQYVWENARRYEKETPCLS